MRKHCKCGYQLDYQVVGRNYEDVFTADQEGEPEQGQQTIRCPGCGDLLRADELLSAYKYDEMKWRDKAAVCCAPPGSAARLFPLYEEFSW